MGPYCVHGSGWWVSFASQWFVRVKRHFHSLSSSLSRLYLQKAGMALLPFRPLLLCHYLKLCLHLGISRFTYITRRMLLFKPRQSCERSHNLAQLISLPWPRQSYQPFCAYLRPFLFHSHKVCISSLRLSTLHKLLLQTLLSRCRAAIPCSSRTSPFEPATCPRY